MNFLPYFESLEIYIDISVLLTKFPGKFIDPSSKNVRAKAYTCTQIDIHYCYARFTAHIL